MWYVIRLWIKSAIWSEVYLWKGLVLGSTVVFVALKNCEHAGFCFLGRTGKLCK